MNWIDGRRSGIFQRKQLWKYKLTILEEDIKCIPGVFWCILYVDICKATLGCPRKFFSLNYGLVHLVCHMIDSLLWLIVGIALWNTPFCVPTCIFPKDIYTIQGFVSPSCVNEILIGRMWMHLMVTDIFALNFWKIDILNSIIFFSAWFSIYAWLIENFFH